MKEILPAKAVIEFRLKCPHCDDITYAYEKEDFECILYHGFMCRYCKREFKVILENCSDLSDDKSERFPYKTC